MRISDWGSDVCSSDLGGSVTRFSVRSTGPALEEVVDVTAVYRAADGRILGADSTTIPQIAPDTSVEVSIRPLSPIPDLASPAVFVGRGIGPQTVGRTLCIALPPHPQMHWLQTETAQMSLWRTGGDASTR